jgi:kinetochore protein NDC80
VSYLTSRGYGDASSLSVKQLVNSGPSGRDFQNIMTFLFRRVDPTFHSTPIGHGNNQRSDEVVLKFEDEVSMAFRCLGYPFPISKTGLVAVGSPHTWPALIAAIDWLVDLLVIRDEEEPLGWGLDEGMTGATNGGEQNALTLDESAERVRMQFHKFLRKSMVAFLNDDNDECEELEGSLLDSFQKDSERVEMYLTGLDDECGRMREEIASLNEEVIG